MNRTMTDKKLGVKRISNFKNPNILQINEQINGLFFKNFFITKLKRDKITLITITTYYEKSITYMCLSLKGDKLFLK